MPFVSVVIPTLNVAPYIRECIDSAICQSLEDIEIICVDAGSTDGTLEILQEYAASDKRISVIQSSYKSYGYQMNLGLDAASGKYFAILESDDYIKEDTLRDLYSVCEENQLDFVKADYSIFFGDEDNRRFQYQTGLSYPEHSQMYGKIVDPFKDFFVFKSYNVIWNGLYSIPFLRENGIRFHETPGASYQDNGFWFLTMCRAHRVMFLNQDYYMLRRDNPNSSIKSKGKVYCICEEYDYIREELSKCPSTERMFAPLCAMKRFKNYEWNYRRIADSYKEEFVRRFSEDFQKIYANGEIEGNLYSQEESFRLKMLLECPIAYTYHCQAVEGKCGVKSPKEGKKLLMPVNEVMDYLPHEKLKKWLRKGLRFLGINYVRFEPKPILVQEAKPRDYDFYFNLSRDCYVTELHLWYQDRYGEALNLDYPKTFNEKIQWLKLFDCTALKTIFSDKYQVHEWIKENVGESCLPEMLGDWDSFEKIDFEALPEQFILKANHGEDWEICVLNKAEMDRDALRKQFTDWMQTNYAFVNGFELQYMKIEPKIIAEACRVSQNEKSICCEVYCFNGKPMHIWVNNASCDRRAVLDVSWQRVHTTDGIAVHDEAFRKPQNYDDMMRGAESICQNFAFAKVCFNIAQGRAVFDRVLFTSPIPLETEEDRFFNEAYGAQIHLPIKAGIPSNPRHILKTSLNEEPPEMGELKGVYTVHTACDLQKVLDIAHASIRNCANVYINQAMNVKNQQFELRLLRDGSYVFLNVKSGKALDVAAAGMNPCTNVQQWTYTGADHQRWILEDTGDGYVYIRAKHSGMLLDLCGGITEDKTNIQVYSDKKTVNQKFKLISVGETSF